LDGVDVQASVYKICFGQVAREKAPQVNKSSGRESVRRWGYSALPHRHAPLEASVSASCDDVLTIAVVNNMPDAAFQTTERQLRNLLRSGAGNARVELRLFSLREQRCGADGTTFPGPDYESLDDLWSSDIDGMIVTGTEPRSVPLHTEPYWPTLTKLVDWAEQRTVSTIWLCLAAHAAVLYLDGIERCLLPRKLSGVFDCIKSDDHSILAGSPSRWLVPHSRFNDLPEQRLAACDYSILSRSDHVGADIFVKQRQSLFVFMQGHLEYDPCTLLREYRRDVGRFLSGQRALYPDLPCGYFERPIETAVHPWQTTAQRIYGNWLTYLADAKAERLSREASALGIGCSWQPGLDDVAQLWRALSAKSEGELPVSITE
jgi:homoserine O-succinyltransferase